MLFQRLVLYAILVCAGGTQAADSNPAATDPLPKAGDAKTTLKIADPDPLSKPRPSVDRGMCVFGPRDPEGRKLAVERYGGSAATEASVELALKWLARHQEPDGHWSATKFGANNQVDTAVTGLALLAFLGAGHTEKGGAWTSNVWKAVSWLRSKQEPNGLIFDRSDIGGYRGIGYPAAIATLAMCEASAMGRQAPTQGAAQRAIGYCTREHQQGEGVDRLAWRYAAKTAGDISVSGWFIAALQSGKTAGLAVDSPSFDGASQFLDSVETKEKGVRRYSYQPGKDSNRRRNAVGLLCRQLLGTPKELLQASVEAFVADGGEPKWSNDGQSVDLYYWYFATSCVFQQGGELWKRWNDSLKKALVDNQLNKGDDAGTWPLAGDFSTEWGRVGQTALGCLCLEVYYRYKLTDMKK
jgi:hypothetical protein